MSTRRATIKTVPSLPPRRKKAVQAENTAKEIAEKTSRSPRTPLNEINSPLIKTDTELSKTLENIAQHNVIDDTNEKSPSVCENTYSTPEEVHSKFYKINHYSNVFSSPRSMISPIAPTPDANKSSDAQRVSPYTAQSGTGSAHKISDNSELQISETIVNKVDYNVSKKDNVKDDYSIPYVLISDDDDEAMDGIAPLKPATSVSKRIEIWKNELLSGNAEVLFDPITPLPTPITNCTKLRPVPGFAPLQRKGTKRMVAAVTATETRAVPQNKLGSKGEIIIDGQSLGSSSKSKDQNPRSLSNSKDPQAHDVYNLQSVPDSITDYEILIDEANEKKEAKKKAKGTVAAVTAAEAAPVPQVKLGPKGEVILDEQSSGTSSETEDENRQHTRTHNDPQPYDVYMQSVPNRFTDDDRNRRLRREKTRLEKERRQLEFANRGTLTMYDLISNNPSSNPLVLSDDEIIIEEANEAQEAEKEAEGTVAAVSAAETLNKSGEAAPVPQVKLGPKGEVILDEQSLVIKQSGSNRKVSSEVHGGARGTGGKQRKQNRRGPNWTAAETVRFYRALRAVGSDFTLMTELFPGRTRKQLKGKFKREEKSNCEQVDKALYGPGQFQFDLEKLKKEFEEERALDARQAELEREWIQREKLAERERCTAAKKRGMRLSRAAKALEITMEPFHPDAVTADDIIALHTQRIQKSKQPARQKPPKLAAMKSKQPAPQKPPKLAARAVVGSTSKPKEDTASNRTNTPSLQAKTPEAINTLQIPTNIETGSLVVLTVNDPASPSKRMLQSYNTNGPGNLAPGTPVGYNVASPFPWPSSVASIESQDSASSGVAVLPSAAKRQRHSSYTITQL